MNKPLSEWTTKEIVEECDRHVCCSSECRCYNSERKKCRLKPFPPPYWNLSEPPRWTEQDKEDAKAVRHLMPWATKVGRGRDYDSLMLNSSVGLHRDLFPSLKPGETVTLDEIIGGGE